MNAPPATAGHDILERVLAVGDLAQLTPAERNAYYNAVCRSTGLNPLTRPLEYIRLQGKLVLYARRDAADQLRKLHGVSLRILSQEFKGDLFSVTVEAKDKDGRIDCDMGVVSIAGLKGEMLANAILKGLTKAKRRVTLSIAGLGFLDETEVADVPRHQAWQEPAHDQDTGEVLPPTSRGMALPPHDRMTRAALDTLETTARDMDAARPRIPPDEVWLAEARKMVAEAPPDALRSWWNSHQQKTERQDLHKRRADMEPALKELKRRVVARWWECSNLEIPPNGMGWQKWQGLMARTIDAAPTVEKLEKLLVDNVSHLAALAEEVPKAAAALQAKIENARLLLADNEAPIDLGEPDHA